MAFSLSNLCLRLRICARKWSPRSRALALDSGLVGADTAAASGTGLVRIVGATSGTATIATLLLVFASFKRIFWRSISATARAGDAGRLGSTCRSTGCVCSCCGGRGSAARIVGATSGTATIATLLLVFASFKRIFWRSISATARAGDAGRLGSTCRSTGCVCSCCGGRGSAARSI